MNSNITTYPMNRPVKWSEFRGWPADIQEAYLKNIYNSHHATGRMLADMFDRHPQTVQQYLALHNLPTSPYRGASRKNRADWVTFCLGGHPDPVGEPGEPGEPGVTGVPDVIEVHKISPVDPKTGTVAFDGNVEDVLVAIRRMFAGNPNLRMSVTWEANDD